MFEYASFEFLPADLQRDLNAMGTDGWELAFLERFVLSGQGERCRCWFKRRLPEPDAFSRRGKLMPAGHDPRPGAVNKVPT